MTDDPLDRAPCGFLRFADGGGAILRTNATFLAMLGYLPGELEGLGVDAVLSSGARLFCQTHFFPLLKLRGEAEEIYLSLLDKQGETVPVLVNAVRRETDGEAFIDCVFVRMKQRGHYEDALLLATREAERTAAQLREREHFLQRVADVSPGVLQVFDLEKQSTTFINRPVASMLGYTAEEIIAMGDDVVPTLMHPDDLARWPAHLDRVRALRDDEIADFEHRLRDRAGEWHWFHSRDAVFARDAAGAARQLIGTAIEITKRKQAEEQLRESAEILAQVSDVVGMIDNDERILFLNAAGEHLYRVRAADVLGRDLSELYQRRWLKPGDEAAAHATLREQGEAVWELIHITRDGRELHVQSNVCLMRDATGDVTGIIAAIRDISERRAIDAKLRASEAEFRATFEQSPVGKAQVCAKTGRFLRVNLKFCEMTGYSAEELAGMTPADITFPEDRDVDAARFLPLLIGQVPTYENEKRYVRKDGEIIWVHANATILRDDDGRPERTMAVVQDITARKKAEVELRRSTAFLQAISESTGDVIFAKDADGLLIYANPATLELIGKSLPDVLGRTDVDFLSDRAAAQQVMANDRRIMDSGIAEDVEEVVPLPDGTLRTWLSRKTPYRDEKGNVVGLLGVSRDITARKRAEEELRESEERLGRLHHAISDPALTNPGRLSRLLRLGIEEFGLENGFVAEIADGLYRVVLADTPDGSVPVGFTCDARDTICAETLRRNDLVAIDSLAETDWRTHRAYSEFGTESYFGVPLPVEGKIFGTLCYTSRTPRARGFSTGDHEFLRLLAQTMGTEMTRQQIAAKLSAAEERQRFAMQAANAGSWDWDIGTGDIVWSRENYALYDFDPAQGSPRYADWESRVHPDDLAHANSIVRDVVEGKSPEFRSEFRVVHRDGEVIWLLGLGRVQLDSGGTAIRLSGINIDITARKLAEERLRVSEERFRIAENSSLSFVYEWDVTSGRETRSAGFTKVLGYEADEFPYGGEAWEALIHPDDVPRVREATFGKLPADGPSHVEYRLRRKDDEWRWVFDEFVQFRDRHGNLARVVGSIVDISDQKKAQARIQNLNIRLQRSVAESHHRIKNNLQVLSAMIELQSDGEDDTAKEKWNRLSNHIRSLASLHDILTLETRDGDGDVDTIEVYSVLEKLFPLLSIALGGRHISLNADRTVALPLKEVSSFVLLVNELVSNARKHGDGDIEVSLKRASSEVRSEVRLEVCDDGPGFPADFDPQNDANTGLEIIGSLVGWDLGGAVAYETRPEGGARVVVTFPLPETR